MANGNNDIEELEDLLTELEGQDAQMVAPYSEDEDAVTQLMEAPLEDQQWMVQLTALDRRMMAKEQLIEELTAGNIDGKTLVWRGGMDDWTPVERVDGLAEILAATLSSEASPPTVSSATASVPPPAPSATTAPTLVAPVVESSAPEAAPISVSRPSQPAPPVPSPQTYTARPVAVDFSGSAVDREDSGLLQSKRAVFALGTAAVLGVLAVAYSVSSGGGSTASSEPIAAISQQEAATGLDEAAAGSEVGSTTAEDSDSTEEAAKAEDEEGQTDEVASATAQEEKAEANDEEAEDATEEVATAEAKPSPLAKMAKKTARPRSKRWRRRTVRRKPPTVRSQPAETAPAAAVEEPESLAQAMKSRVASNTPSPSSEPEARPEVAAPSSASSTTSARFDRDAAKLALDEAASTAANCRPAGGVTGDGRVQVRYDNTGKVVSVKMLTERFAETTTGTCVRQVFRGARIPEFAGSPAYVNKSFSIP